MITALIVDDEPQARNVLRHHLKSVEPEISVLDEASGVDEALVKIGQQHPDIVFLDIEMPQKSGFSLFDEIPEPEFQVIFVTASRDYAIDAFRVSALDYILKPIEPEQLQQAVSKATSQRLTSLKKQVDMLDRQLSSGSDEVSTLVLSTNQSIDFVSTDAILYLKANGAYTECILDDGRIIMVSKPLADYQFLENSSGFFKTHRSYIVNISKVVRFLKEDGGQIVMKNGDKVSISRYRKEAFLKEIARL